jgi:hypothetical protein
MVPKRQTRLPAFVIDDDENEKTRVYAGSWSGVLDAREERWPEEQPERPSGSWSESRSGLALSRTLRPLAAGLRSFPFAYVFSIAALGMSGAAWYLSRTAPVDAGHPPAAAAPAKPSPPVAAAPPLAPPSAEIAQAASVAPPKPAPAAQLPARKTPIDVMSLPVAPPAPANRAPTRSAR